MTAKDHRYYPLLDAFRFLAAIAIVWLHVAGVPSLERSKVLGRFAVPFFTCAASFLAADTLRRRPDTSIGQYFAGRFWRIYPLFLAWSVIYWAMRCASSVLLEHKGWIKPTPREFLLDGVAIQLWFLPFIIVATTAAFAAAKLARLAPDARLPLAVIAVAGGLLATLFPGPAWVQAAGYSPWLSYGALPACTWGIALALLVGPAGEFLQPRLSALVAALGAAGVGTWLVRAMLYERSVLWENVAGLGLFLVALCRVTPRPTPLLATLGSISFGIYLAHAVFVEGLQHVLPKIGLGPSGWRDGMVWILAVAGSSALVFLLRRGGRWTAWLAG